VFGEHRDVIAEVMRLALDSCHPENINFSRRVSPVRVLVIKGQTVMTRVRPVSNSTADQGVF